MIIFFLVLAITCICRSVSTVEDDNICHYNYNYNSALQHNRVNQNISSYINQVKQCTAEYIPKDVVFNVMSDEKNSSSRGVISVDFKSPKIECRYKVALFVNPYINDNENCKKYQFDQVNLAEIHTLEKNICPTNESEVAERDQETIRIESSHKEKNLSLWYEYIYTGCYALGFKVEKRYIFVGNEFLKTEYKKVDVTEPKILCTYYKTAANENDSSDETVTVTTDMSLLAGSSGLRLELAPTSLLHKNVESSCYRYSENPVAKLLLGMSLENDTDIADNNCTLTTTSLSSGDLLKKVECNFVIQNSPKDVGYCFMVRILDERCHKNTSWKPPIKDNVPCGWTSYCLKTEQKRTAVIEEIKKTNDIKNLKVPRILYMILFVAIVLIVLAVLSTIFIAYRIHLQRTKNSLHTKIKKDFGEDGSTIIELGSSKSQHEKLVKESGIVILYVRESDQFMDFMTEFRNSLKQYTGCDVYDWWAPDLWNDVARIGGYEWVIKMIRNDCRVVWIDTLKARALFTLQHKNGYKFKQLKQNWQSQEISDFRDSVFPAIVDFAKRSNQDIEQEYQRHFVVRLENFENADKIDDPFADLSPHARFLIPCHLDKLCCQLSISEPYFNDEMNMDKVHLRKYLLQETAVNL